MPDLVAGDRVTVSRHPLRSDAGEVVTFDRGRVGVRWREGKRITGFGWFLRREVRRG